MAFIEISNLNAAGSDLFTGSDSFLTELQPTDTNQIFGGSKNGGRGGRRSRSRSHGGRRSHGGGRRSHGGGGGGGRNWHGSSGGGKRSHGGGRWYC